MIIGVAVIFKPDVQVRLPKPSCHSDCFEAAKKEHGLKESDYIGSHGQGFYTDAGEFLDRKEAMVYVKKNSQELLPNVETGLINKTEFLYSSDLWCKETKES